MPGRCEPGTGEIAYPAVARALAEMGYPGTIGIEAFASGDPATAVAAFREAFTPLSAVTGHEARIFDRTRAGRT